LRDWLLEPTTIAGVTKRNIERINCIFTLRQIAAFSLEEGNYDAVMSLVGCILGLRETESIAEQEAVKRSKANRLRFITDNPRLFNNEINKHINKQIHEFKYDN
jgi:hypothetical protein